MGMLNAHIHIIPIAKYIITQLFALPCEPLAAELAFWVADRIPPVPVDL